MYKINHAELDEVGSMLMLDCTDEQGKQIAVNISMSAALAAGIIACEPLITIESAVEIAMTITGETS